MFRSGLVMFWSYSTQLKTLRKLSSLAVVAPVPKRPILPKGLVLEALNHQRHDISQFKHLLTRAFVENNEPIISSLGELYYPAIPKHKRVPLIEERLKKIFCEEALQEKVNGGLSVVAVKETARSEVVSVLFAERCNGEAYNSLVDDPLCQTGLNLMRTVHSKALPTLQRFNNNATVLISHCATLPEYKSLGIMRYLYTKAIDIFMENEVEAVYCITTAKRLTDSLLDRGFNVAAEVFYKDYKDKGTKVFRKLAEKDISAKALVLCL